MTDPALPLPHTPVVFDHAHVLAVAPGTRFGPPIAEGRLSRREATATLADWLTNLAEGGR
jgi:hypothetical protein